MNVIYENQERDRILQARESFSGRLLTDSQFDEAMAITSIMEREIHKSGAFKQKLGDYAYAYARTEKLDAMKAKEGIRDLFKIRTGQTMNTMREAMMKREAELFSQDGQPSINGNGRETNKARQPQLSDDGKLRAYRAATELGQMIENGDKMSFFRAYSHQAAELAKDFGITESGAKKLMKQQFHEFEGRDLYQWGKDLEEQYYRPQIEAGRKTHDETRENSIETEKQRSFARSR